MKSKLSFSIAGSKTNVDWLAIQPALSSGSDPNMWRRAVEDFFHERLRGRYLDPIEILQGHSRLEGEGFSIVAIQCTLIEFLESTIQGVNYRYVRRPGDLGDYEYSNSRDVFMKFLTQRVPFSAAFDAALAAEFYADIRCGVLHEARSKGRWRIHAKSMTNKIVDQSKKVLYRNDFQAGILHVIRWYEESVPNDLSLQEAFIRKFDSLASE